MVSSEKKAEVVKQIEQKTMLEAEQALVSIFPQIAPTIHQERVTVINESTSRMATNLPNETLKDLERVKELLSHSHPNATNAEIIAYVLKDYIVRKDPLLKDGKTQATDVCEAEARINNKVTTERGCESSPAATGIIAKSEAAKSDSAPAAQCVPVKSSVRRFVLQRADGRCEYRDPITGRVCGSRWQVEVDMIFVKWCKEKRLASEA